MLSPPLSSFSPIVPAGGKGVYSRDKADVSAKDELCPEGNRAGTVLKPQRPRQARQGSVSKRPEVVLAF